MSKESLEEVTQKFIDAETERRAEYDADFEIADECDEHEWHFFQTEDNRQWGQRCRKCHKWQDEYVHADSAAPDDDDGPNGLTFADDVKIEAMEKRVAELEIKAKLFDRLYKWYWTPDNETVTVGDDLLAIMDEYRQIEKEGKH